MKILVAYDGTVHAKKALRYGLRKIQETGGEITALHVFDRNLFVDYDAGPRAEEMARAEAGRYLDDAREIITETAAGVHSRILSEEGDAESIIRHYAESESVDLILAPPRYKALAKTAPCPVYVIPGTILVPVDNTEGALVNAEKIHEEATVTGSKVVILGIVPIHLYSREEKKELENVKKETASVVKKLKKALSERGIDASEAVRSGYPDEEILKAADEHSASLIMFPSGGTTPSELSKAAAILLDEPGRLKRPVLLMPAEGAA